MMLHPTEPLGAIPYGKDGNVDAVMRIAAGFFRQQSLDVLGYFQVEVRDSVNCCPETRIERIDNGQSVRISQPLGSGSRGCRLDPEALMSVCGSMLVELERRPDLVILNRFGKAESEGHGLRAVFIRAAELGIPVLTSVKDSYVDAWHDFAGPMGKLLAPDIAAISAWHEALMANGSPMLLSDHGERPSAGL